MAQNIQMNILQNNGQYETIYPQTTTENVVDIQNNYYNKTETLTSDVSSSLGLSTSATPNDMFSVLANIGDLYIWKKSTVIEQGTPAGYTLGSVQSSQQLGISSNSYLTIYYSDTVQVTDDGSVVYYYIAIG